MSLAPEAIATAAADLGTARPEDAVRWAVDTFGDGVMLANSFGLEDVVLTHMLSEATPDGKCFWLDTDFLFADTHQTREKLQSRYSGLEFVRIPSSLTVAGQETEHGPELWTRDPDLCCSIRKVTPLQGILGTLDAWITGIRREQSPSRANTQPVEWDAKFNLVKVNPLAAWSETQVWSYVHEHEIPFNPMHQRGYPSIGCTHCTRAVAPGEDPRAGRWSGLDKTECGLHQRVVGNAT